MNASKRIQKAPSTAQLPSSACSRAVHHAAAPAGKLFHVDLEERASDGPPWRQAFETRLHGRLLSKTLADALVVPAMDMYYKSEHHARRAAADGRAVERAPLAAVGVTVNSVSVSAAAVESTAPTAPPRLSAARRLPDGWGPPRRWWWSFI